MDLKKQTKNLLTFLLSCTFIVVSSLSLSAQDRKMDDQKLKAMQEKNENYVVDIYEITAGYPDFNYEYIYDNGVLKEVNVTGITEPSQLDRVTTLLYNMRLNKDLMKNYCDTHGIYYAPEKEAEPTIGYHDYREAIQDNLEYPKDAESKGVEGTVYVKFIVDANGNVTNLTADQAIDSPFVRDVEKMQEEALAAVDAVDAEWEPAMVDGDHVDSWVVVPVTFDFRKDPALPVLIR